MKAFGLAGIGRRICWFVVLLIFVGSPLRLRAQLVADGQTAILDGVATNIADTVTVGTNGSFTLLVLTNGSAVTNSGIVNIGLNSSAGHNTVALNGSTWLNTGAYFAIGRSGSFNELDILGGSTVSNIYGYIGFGSPSSNNTVVVSGPGSSWQSGFVYIGQSSSGADNLLIVSNGAKVASSSSTLGVGFGRNSSAIVTGANSVWTNSAGLSVGAYGTNSCLMVTNGGAVFSSGLCGLGMQGAASVSNLAVITDAGSSWTSRGTFYVGEFSSGNQLKILNGGKLVTQTTSIGDNAVISNNLVLVDGAGSFWTNSTGFVIGNNGSRNTLIVSNGGRINDLNTALVNMANGSSSSNNTVIITGAGSAFNCGVFNAGFAGPGGNQVRIENGGKFTVSLGAFALGNRCNSNLLVLADTNSVLQCNGFHMGNQSTNNQCVVSNGATLAVVANQGNLINGTYTLMTVTGGGTTCTFAGDLRFGGDSDVLAITSGGALVDTNGFAANTVIVADTNSLWKNFGDFHFVDVTGGQLFITNGGTLLASNSYFGESSNSMALVSGAGSLWTNQDSLYIGSNGPNNTVTVTDAGALRARTLFVGTEGGQNQLIVNDSGSVTIGSLLVGTVGNSPSNSVTLSGGTITITNVSGVLLNQGGTLTVNSGLLTTPAIATEGLGTAEDRLILNGGTLQSGFTSYRSPGPFIVGDGINPAVFEMLASIPGSHSFSNGVVVANNGLLKGFGMITDDVSVNSGGAIAPGTDDTIGTIVVRGHATLNPGSTTLMKLNALSGASDQLSATVGITCGGTLQLNTIAGSLAAGQSFTLFPKTNCLGAFDNLVPAIPGPGLKWNTNGLNINGVLRVESTTTTPPALQIAMMAGGNLAINATGGLSGNPCYLLTCTNFPPAPADWTCVATNYFDATGATSFTNAIPAGEAQRYFKVQVN